MKWKQRELEFRVYKLKEENYIMWDNLTTAQGNDIFKLSNSGVLIVQYTGVKDIKGKRVFEGDIVKILNDFGTEVVGFVQYDLGGAVFRIQIGNNGGYLLGITTIQKSITILGNAFQNPELVKKYKLEID